ncbi:MAG: DUF59 domain-containing protein [Bacteroidales bacterium]|nr:DUF59 domain-containing protein [Bacteroidales bacterium]
MDVNNLSAEQQAIVEVLKGVYDPEIPVNIWDMGFIYDIVVDNQLVYILMTLTAPNCPVAETLPIEVEDRVKQLPFVKDVAVDITFDPIWTMDNMSEAAKLELGFL